MSFSPQVPMNQPSKSQKSDQPKTKYYVQSANVEWILLATDPGVAALQLVQKTFEPAIKSHQKITSGLKMIDHIQVEKLAQPLADEIHVSQSGFGKTDAGTFTTNEVIECWLNQMSAIENLLRKLA